MTDQQQSGGGSAPSRGPARYGSPAAMATMAAAHTARTTPQLARGIVWSDLVREMDEEQAARQEAVGTVTALPAANSGDTGRDDVLGEAA